MAPPARPDRHLQATTLVGAAAGPACP